MSKATTVDQIPRANTFQPQGYQLRKATAGHREARAKKPGKLCVNCLWNWPDVHNPESGEKRCYNVESPFYHTVRPISEAKCGDYEKPVEGMEWYGFDSGRGRKKG